MAEGPTVVYGTVRATEGATEFVKGATAVYDTIGATEGASGLVVVATVSSVGTVGERGGAKGLCSGVVFGELMPAQSVKRPSWAKWRSTAEMSRLQ